MPKDIKWCELFDATEEALDLFINDPKRICHNFIVWIRRQYEYDPMWECSRELLLFEGFSQDGKPKYAWLRDWNEGHDKVEYLAVADLDEDDEQTKEADHKAEDVPPEIVEADEQLQNWFRAKSEEMYAELITEKRAEIERLRAEIAKMPPLDYDKLAENPPEYPVCVGYKCWDGKEDDNGNK